VQAVKNFVFILLFVAISASATQKPRPKAARANKDTTLHFSDTETAGTTKSISDADRAALVDALAAQFKDDSEAKKRAAQTLVKFVDLNRDGVSEAICRPTGESMCSPTGNCPFWVFEKAGATYRLILKKGAAQSFTIRHARTNGYFDLELGMHGSATMSSLFVYRFRGRRYQRAACYDVNFTYLDEHGEVHELDEPRVTPCHK
jgi:hypothetical protein